MAVAGVPLARDWCDRIQPLIRVWDLDQGLQCLCQAPEALQLLKSSQLHSETDLPVLPALSSSPPSLCGTFLKMSTVPPVQMCRQTGFVPLP